MKIAHISDTHISFADKNMHGQKLIEVLTDITARGVDHVIVTGDIADNPEDGDFLYAKELFAHFGLMSGDRMSIVPGNHDIFGGAPGGADFFRFASICRSIDRDRKVDNFIELFKETFPAGGAFPYLKLIENVAIIGLNSVGKWSVRRNPEGSNGIIYAGQLEKLKEILSSEEVRDKVKIVLIHHHLNKPGMDPDYPEHTLWLKVISYKMKLYGKKKLTDLFKKHKVNLVLHGHTHINSIYNIKGVTYLNSSSCVMPITDDLVRKYNIIDIPGSGEDGNITIETVIL